MHLLLGLVFSGSVPWIAPAESNIGFPKYSLVCLLPLFMKFTRNFLSFPAYHAWFLEEFLFAIPSTDGFYRVRKQKRSRGSWRDKTYMGNQKRSSCCSEEVYPDLASPCIIYMDICNYISAHRGVPVMGCYVLWYSWDSSPSFRFGSNLPLDPKFGSLQVCWQNHGHKGRKPDK